MTGRPRCLLYVGSAPATTDTGIPQFQRRYGDASTSTDGSEGLTGVTTGRYWPAVWPVECGANHRPKIVPSRGLGIEPTDRLVANTRHTGRRPVMFIQRDPGQLYLYGTTTASEATVAGWVERVDPITLTPAASSGELPAGGHEWPGSLVAHANGDLYVANGSFVHRLDLACRIKAQRELPVDHAHNGMLILGDGSIATKDLRLGPEPSTLTICNADLDVLTSVELPEASMGRLSTIPAAGGDDIYVVGETRLFRYRWTGRELLIDSTWQPRYRHQGQGGLAWDATIVDGFVWLMNNGSVDTVQRKFSTEQQAHGAYPEVQELPDSTWNDPIRVIGVDIRDPDVIVEITPTENSGGWVIASPLIHDDVLLAWDTCHTGLAGFDVSDRNAPDMLWYQPFRPSMPPLLFPDTNELVVNDFRFLAENQTSDDLVVLDIRTGTMKSRVATGATTLDGMYLTPGWHRDLYYCASGTVARIRVESAL